MSISNERFYEVLYRLSRTLHNTKLDAQTMMQTSLTTAGEVLSLPQGCLVTFNADDDIQSVFVINADNPQYRSNTLWETLLDQGLVGYVYHARRTVVIRNIQTDPRWPQSDDIAAIISSGSAIGLPLHNDSAVYGVMMFIHPHIDYFNEQGINFLNEVAVLTAEAVNHAVKHERDTIGKKIPYQSLFEDAVVPGILTDLDGSIIDVNRMASDLLAYTRRELLRESIFNIHKIHGDVLGGEGLGSLVHGEEMTFRATAINANKEEIPIIMRARRIRLHNKDLIEWVEQDITTQMELEQLRRDLSAMVYHDLRGPLQAIRGSIHKLAEVLANHENPAVLTLLQVSVRSTRQLRRMVDGLLDIQRLEEGKAILNANPAELREILADAVQLVQPLAMDNDQHIKFNVGNDLPTLNVDNDMILRVVINLMENATKYTPAGGTIILGAQRDEHFVYIKVSDSGPGIPKEAQSQIFDKFNRVKYHNAPRGIGLGLAFCRLAVKAHGGDIWVESEPGEGAHFIFTLPIESEITPQKNGLLTQLVAKISA